MSLDQHLLEAFVAVAELGSVGRAAAALNSTQPTISRRVAILERNVEQALFDRHSLGMHLTPAGVDFLSKAKLILEEIRLAIEAMDAHRGLTRGTVRVGGGEAVVRSVLPGVLGEVARRAPQLKIEVKVGSEDQLDFALAQRELDIIFATTAPREVEAEPLGAVAFEDRCVVFCSSDNPILVGEAPSAKRLLEAAWAMPHPGATPRHQFEEMVRKLGMRMPRIALQTESVDVIISLVSRTRIMGWLPAPLLEAAQGSGIVVLNVPELELVRRFVAYRRAHGSFPMAARTFRDCLDTINARRREAEAPCSS